MTVKEKIQYIQKAANLTQAELAVHLGVTFAALNRWVNGRAAPRQSALEAIDELYREYTGEKTIPATALGAKKKEIFRKKKKHPKPINEIVANPDIRDAFLLALTFHSNRMEGSTLSENETAAILFQNAALPNRSLVEQLEAKNHQTALEYLLRLIVEKKPLNEDFILKTHAILINGIRSDAGEYRRHAVRILGANVPTANYIKIPALMKNLAGFMHETGDIIRRVSETHSRFEQIHPFADGNGRVGRLLIHAMLLKENLPPAVIEQKNRTIYMAYLNKSQVKSDFSQIENFICDSVMKGYDILERKQ